MTAAGTIRDDATVRLIQAAADHADQIKTTRDAVLAIRRHRTDVLQIGSANVGGVDPVKIQAAYDALLDLERQVESLWVNRQNDFTRFLYRTLGDETEDGKDTGQ